MESVPKELYYFHLLSFYCYINCIVSYTARSETSKCSHIKQDGRFHLSRSNSLHAGKFHDFCCLKDFHACIYAISIIITQLSIYTEQLSIFAISWVTELLPG